MKKKLYIILISTWFLMEGCVSLVYHQRKLREDHGEEIVKVLDEDQEYRDFMNHIRTKIEEEK